MYADLCQQSFLLFKCVKKILLECWEPNPCSERVWGWREGRLRAGRGVPRRTTPSRPGTIARVCLSRQPSPGRGPVVLSVGRLLQFQGGVSQVERGLLKIVRCLPFVGGCLPKLWRRFWFISKIWWRVASGPSAATPRGELGGSFYSVKNIIKLFVPSKINFNKFSPAL